MNDKDIYSLGLHERINIYAGFDVVRVPGGWVYNTYDIDIKTGSSVFVPYENEFRTIFQEAHNE